MKNSRTARQPLKPAGDIKSEGQRLLLALGLSLGAIAEATGCSRQAALTWRTGAKVPSDEARERLCAVLGIPVAAWTVRAGTSPGTSPGTPAQEAAPALSATPTSLEDCLALHRVIRRERNAQNLTTAERVRLADTEARVLAIRHRLECEAQLLEDRFVREHPAWQRVRAAILRAVAGCPTCNKRMRDELTRVDM